MADILTLLLGQLLARQQHGPQVEAGPPPAYTPQYAPMTQPPGGMGGLLGMMGGQPRMPMTSAPAHQIGGLVGMMQQPQFGSPYPARSAGSYPFGTGYPARRPRARTTRRAPAGWNY